MAFGVEQGKTVLRPQCRTRHTARNRGRRRKLASISGLAGAHRRASIRLRSAALTLVPPAPLYLKPPADVPRRRIPDVRARSLSGGGVSASDPARPLSSSQIRDAYPNVSGPRVKLRIERR